jgi:hypothetical protein
MMMLIMITILDWACGGIGCIIWMRRWWHGRIVRERRWRRIAPEWWITTKGWRRPSMSTVPIRSIDAMAFPLL